MTKTEQFLRDFPKLLKEAEKRQAHRHRIWQELNLRCPPGPNKAQRRAKLLRKLNEENPYNPDNVIVGPWLFSTIEPAGEDE